MGQIEALEGVYIRTGSGERVLSGLIAKIGEFNFVGDNAGCFAGKPFPEHGFTMMLGSFVTYVAVEVVRGYPEQVLVDDETPLLAALGRRITRPESCVEVMVTGPVDAAGKVDASQSKAAEVAKVRSAKPRLEKDLPGTPELRGRGATLVEIVDTLADPVNPGVDIVVTVADLEAKRVLLQKEAVAMITARDEFNRDLREYNAANGFTPVAVDTHRGAEVRQRGKGLNDEINREARPTTSARSESRVSTGRPVYSSPAKNLRAAEAGRAELSGLTGDAWRAQQKRVNELVYVANQQNEALRRANAGAGDSEMVYSARPVSQVSKGQASSPLVGGADRARSVTSGQNQQLQMYDPVLAAKQKVGQGNASRAKGNPGPGNASRAKGNSGQGNQNGGQAASAGRGKPPPPPRYQQQPRPQGQYQREPEYVQQPQNVGQGDDRYDDGDSAMARAGYHRVDRALGPRIGARMLAPGDVRNKLDRIYLSEQLEEEGPPGPACFGPRIMKEPPPPVSQFQ